MKKTLLIIVFLVIGVLSLYFMLNKNGEKASRINIPSISFGEKNKNYSGDISSIVFDLEKIPEDFEIDKRGPRTISDISDEAIEWGWEEGYEISYIKGDYFSGTRIIINISRYPLENISKTVGDLMSKVTEGDEKVEQLPDPRIGEGREAVRVTDEILGFRGYFISFYKKDIYVGLGVGGTVSDYELLRGIAKEIEGRI